MQLAVTDSANSDVTVTAHPLWNEEEYLRLLTPLPNAPSSTRMRELWIRPAMRLYAWALAVAPVASWLGLRHLTPNGLRLLIFGAGAAGLAIGIVGNSLVLVAGAGALLVASVLEARGAARSRVVVDEFTGLKSSESLNSPRLADLLRVELARLGDLFQSVGDKRAVSSGIGPKRALDTTLSVDSVASSLQAAVSAESKVTLGPLSVPSRLVIAIADRLISPPRITGSLHADQSGLVVTAQQAGLSGFTWRVPPQSQQLPSNGAAVAGTDGAAGVDLNSVSQTLRELALRIFTDLALGRSVRWQASSEFVKGLEHVRSCLRAPVDRKVNLRQAEKHFLKTLSEDEDFPHAYYNLGVVYNELFTLAWAAGRTVEARNHLRAAEISFERAIERDPQRWENYFALAQSHFQNCRFDIVIELCARMEELKRRGVVNRAKTRELHASGLLALALNGGGDPKLVAKANRRARRAVRSSMLASLRARLLPGFFEREDELAAACLQTFGLTQSVYARGNSRLWKRTEHIYQRARWLAKENAELRVELGLLALGAGKARLATSQLEAAVRSDPARPLYLAALAAALAAGLDPAAQQPTAKDRDEIKARCVRAAQSMTRAYSPARDAVACDLIARASARLGDDALSSLANELCSSRDEANRRLAGPSDKESSESETSEKERDSGSIVSAAFLQALRSSPAANEVLDEYGLAVQSARQLLDALRREGSVGDGVELDPAELQRQALTEAERATSLNPLSVLAWMTLGDIHQELADYANARESWVNAQTQDPDNPALYDRIGTSWWQLAFRGRARPDPEKLSKAKDFFDKAMLLYEAGTLKDQIRTRYRLGKLHVARHEFDAALGQFQIVETAAHHPPIVGWALLGRAYLERRDYAEAEYYFERVIEAGALLDSGAPLARLKSGAIDPVVDSNRKPTEVIGTRIDEQRRWPLAITRAWGYLGLALSYIDRDGDLDKANRLVDSARMLARSPTLDGGEHLLRITAACDDCEGSILYKKRAFRHAAAKLKLAVERNPYSRTYVNLGWTYVAIGNRPRANRGDWADRASRCVAHAVSLDRARESSPEIAELRSAITGLSAAPASRNQGLPAG